MLNKETLKWIRNTFSSEPDYGPQVEYTVMLAEFSSHHRPYASYIGYVDVPGSAARARRQAYETAAHLRVACNATFEVVANYSKKP